MDIYKLTRELCQVYDIKPSRSKGQNFLIKESVYDQIIAAADLKADDVVLEVGPGLGFLTSKLAKIVKKVIAVELDDKLAEVLRIRLKTQNIDNVEVVNQNVLDFNIFSCHCERQRSNLGEEAMNQRSLASLSLQRSGPRSADYSLARDDKFKIVANLPYNISSVFLRRFLEREEKPELMVLMLQKEVAERICALPGKMSLLAVSVQFYAEPEIVQSVDADCFWPEPEIESAIVKLKVDPSPFIKERIGGVALPIVKPTPTLPLLKGGGKFEKEFFRLVKIGFSARRKMLKNNLAAGFRIDQKIIAEKIKMAGLSENCRSQELSVEDWIRLAALIC